MKQPMPHRPDIDPKAAQKHLAQQCRTTVISGLHAFGDRTEALVASSKEGGRDGRFDLLTVLDPDALGEPSGKALLDQVVSDARLALELHNGERIVVAAYGDPRRIVRALTAHPKLASKRVPVDGIDLRRFRGAQTRPPTSPTIAVSCMDFRQHDAGLADALKKGLDLFETPAVFAMAGGAKELDGATKRSHLVRQQLQKLHRGTGFRQLVLTCHTDCGAFGGDASFNGQKHQQEELTTRLRRAASIFRPFFPSINLKLGIVRLKDGGVEKIIPVASE